jgi:hypothetical protein
VTRSVTMPVHRAYDDALVLGSINPEERVGGQTQKDVINAQEEVKAAAGTPHRSAEVVPDCYITLSRLFSSERTEHSQWRTKIMRTG